MCLHDKPEVKNLPDWLRNFAIFDTRPDCSNKIAGGGGAPQASYDKHRHRNCLQTQPLQGISKNVNISRSWGQRSVDTIIGLHRPPKEAFSEARVHAATTQVDFEVDRPQPADSPPGDILITMVKETVIIYKRVSKK